jgi:hypothetical protein
VNGHTIFFLSTPPFIERRTVMTPPGAGVRFDALRDRRYLIEDLTGQDRLPYYRLRQWITVFRIRDRDRKFSTADSETGVIYSPMKINRMIFEA